MSKRTKSRHNAQHRLHALCPYFAMFPPAFVRGALKAHTLPGDMILDPFSGRGTTLLESLLMERNAICADINPVAYCVSAAKADVPSQIGVFRELQSLQRSYSCEEAATSEAESQTLPVFFKKAFHPDTLKQILYLRRHLNWRGARAQRFLAAVVLGHLHGETDRSPNYLSNQMPHTISTKPDYSVRYWRHKRLRAPRRDVFELLQDRIRFRLQDGVPSHSGTALMCDARTLGSRLNRQHETVKLVITSPPYLDVTKFEEDQWLRLWFLGGSPKPTYGQVSGDDRYGSGEKYWNFLGEVWKGIAPLVRSDGHLICRIGSRGLSASELTDGLISSVREAWPNCELRKTRRSAIIGSQSAIFNPDATGCRYEIDFSFSFPTKRSSKLLTANRTPS